MACTRSTATASRARSAVHASLEALPSTARSLARGTTSSGREASTGVLWLYPGNGTGGWLSRVRADSGWNGLDPLF